MDCAERRQVSTVVFARRPTYARANDTCEIFNAATRSSAFCAKPETAICHLRATPFRRLLNFDLAKRAGGRFLLAHRSDIDATRCKLEFEDSIFIRTFAGFRITLETPGAPPPANPNITARI